LLVWLVSDIASAVPKQIVVLETPAQSTDVSVEHRTGDRVAVVELVRPPPDTLDVLRRQTGAFLLAVDRQQYLDDRLTVLFRLSTDLVQIQVDRLKKERAIAFGFRARRRMPVPDRTQFFGRVPGIHAFTHLPAVFPTEPGDAPCPGSEATQLLEWSDPADDVLTRFDRIQNQACADYLAGRLAMDAIRNHYDLRPFEAWSFRFDPRTPWRASPRAFAHTVLAAGEILTRTGYFPEAEVMLTGETFRPRSLRLHQALALASLAYAWGKPAEVEPLLAPAEVLATSDRLRLAASELRARAMLAQGQAERALEIIESALQRVQHLAAVPGQLFTYGGDIALAAEQLDRARRLYRAALRTQRGPARWVALLRLGDLAARSGAWRRANRLYSRAQPQSACLVAHQNLRQDILSHRSVEDIERVLTLAEERAVCDSERRLSLYMLTILYTQIGIHEQAVPLALAWNRSVPPEFRNDAVARPLLQEVSLNAARRLARHDDWQKLVTLYEKELVPASEQGILLPETELLVARGMFELGLAETAAAKLKTVLARQVERPMRDRIAALMAEAYLKSGDLFRAGLLHRYFEAELGDSSERWRADLVAAQLDLEAQRPNLAIRRLRSADDRTPAGDPEFHRRWLLARIDLARGKVDAGAEKLAAALEDPLAPPVDDPGLVVEILSHCLREQKPCAGSLWPVVLRHDPTLITPRLQWRAQRLGLAEADELEDPLVDTLSSVARGSLSGDER
jgi:hypothetical protein